MTNPNPNPGFSMPAPTLDENTMTEQYRCNRSTELVEAYKKTAESQAVTPQQSSTSSSAHCYSKLHMPSLSTPNLPPGMPARTRNCTRTWPSGLSSPCRQYWSGTSARTSQTVVAGIKAKVLTASQYNCADRQRKAGKCRDDRSRTRPVRYRAIVREGTHWRGRS